MVRVFIVVRFTKGELKWLPTTMGLVGTVILLLDIFAIGSVLLVSFLGS